MGLMDRLTKKKAAPAAGKKVDEKANPSEVSNTKDTELVAPVTKLAHQVLVRPVVTEKAAILQSANKYVFMVVGNAKKPQIRQAIKERYGVDAENIRVINVQGRNIRFGRGYGKRSDFKKAIITLPKGKSITIHEGV